jgi:hypothetical protein
MDQLPIAAHLGLLDPYGSLRGLPVAWLLWSAAFARTGTLQAVTVRLKQRSGMAPVDN